ncbi:MAG: pseudouridine synthase [Saprospiraceae bacterium]
MRKNLFEKNIMQLFRAKLLRLAGTLVDYLLKDEKSNIVSVWSEGKAGAKRAEMNYKVISTIGNKTLVEVELITGRSHQIRAQLSHHFAPILADVKYGSTYKTKNRCLYLHCFELSIPHPVTKEMMKFTMLPNKNDNIWQQFF